MTDDRSLERAARSWIEDGPTRAPDRPVDAALLQIMNTPQERDPWIPRRLPDMSPTFRLAGVAIVLVVAVGVAVFALRPSSGTGSPATPGATTSSSAVPSASPTPITPPIADGSYAVDLPVAGILAALDADTTLSAASRTAIIDDVLVIRGKTTLNLRITVLEGQFTLQQGTDGAPLLPSTPWGMTTIDARTVQFTNIPTTVSTQRYEVVPGPQPGSFTLRPISGAGSAVETFVREILFSTAPFVPSP